MAFLNSDRASTQAAADRLFAAVDLGSNSFHMVVARVDHGLIYVVDRHREMVRLADGLDENNHLSLEARGRALRALARFGQRLRDRVRVVGTNTLRRAVNARVFLIAAQNALGHPIDVVAGHEEARLIYRGVDYDLSHPHVPRLAIDIGGGSTEFMHGENGSLLEAESIGFGCVGITNAWFGDGKITAKRWHKAYESVASEMQGLDRLLALTGEEDCVGSSGTIRAAANIARIAGWCGADLNSYSVGKLRAALLDAGHVSKLKLSGLSEQRKPVFTGGVLVLDACFQALEIERMRVSNRALREGLLTDLVGRFQHADPRDITIQALATRHSVDARQADRVQQTAVALFDEVADAWYLGADHRQMLCWAARVHEIGLSVSHSRYHVHGAYLLRHHGDLAGFSRQQQAVLAALVGNHRRKLVTAPTDEDVPAQDQSALLHLCCLLRLAALMNRSRVEKAHRMPELVIEGDILYCRLPSGSLEVNPLTRLDLEQEQHHLSKVGIDLRTFY